MNIHPSTSRQPARFANVIALALAAVAGTLPACGNDNEVRADATALVDAAPQLDVDAAVVVDIGAGPCSVDFAPCDDGDDCTQGDACKAGLCTGVPVCACHDDQDCPPAADLCLGVQACDTSVFPYQCVRKPGSEVVCDTSKDTVCTKTSCKPSTGTCVEQLALNGTPCVDGDPCTVEDRCNAGSCVGQGGDGSGPCECSADADCAKLDDGDACTGTLYCDKALLPYRCKVNPSTVVVCDPGDDTTCLKRACTAGSCGMKPVETLVEVCAPGKGCGWVSKATAGKGPACDDGDACTVGDACADGSCKAGATDTCVCSSDADCDGQEDGDLCNGVLYCDLTLGKCKVNPATIISCNKAQDTACVQNACVAQTGTCVLGPVKNGTGCDDDEACTGLDLCLGGACVGLTNICVCASDADCVGKDDGNVCNGTSYCNGDGVCVTNPATIVQCPSANDTSCLKSACLPLSGACTETAVERTTTLCDTAGTTCRREVLPVKANDSGPHGCDDGDVCSVGDLCAQGSCLGGTYACFCNADSDCADDGDLCNGTPFCDKSNPKAPTCKVNPATAVVCPTVDETACLQASCQPKTGSCALEPRPNGVACEDGKACTKSDYCLLGQCVSGAQTCVCEINADCASKEDGNTCNGTLYCDTSDLGNHTCKVNPATVVQCPVDAPACQAWSCTSATGQCLLGPASGAAGSCDDGDACTVNDVCKGGACKGGAKSCDDGDACSIDSCAPGGTCLHSKISCDDGNDCTLDACNPKTGDCSHAALAMNGKVCDADGSGCTINDSCDAGACKAGTIVACAPIAGLQACKTTVCASTGAQTFQCVPAAAADGSACDDGDACTLPGSCKAGACQALGKAKLWSGAVGLPWAATQAIAHQIDVVSAETALDGSADGALVAGQWAASNPANGRGWWWGRIAEGGVQTSHCVLLNSGATELARPVAALPDDGGGWKLVGSLGGDGGDLQLAIARVTADCQVLAVQLTGAKDVPEIANAVRAHGAGLVAAGHRVRSGNPRSLVAQLTSSGQAVWLWEGAVDGSAAMDAVGRSDGGVLAVGRTVVSGQGRAEIVRLDANGKLVTSAVLGDGGDHRLEAMSPLGSTSLAVGRRVLGGVSRLWWVALDSNGAVQWTRDGVIGLQPTALRKTDAGLLLVGTTNPSGADGDLFAGGVDDHGNVRWEFALDGGLGGSGRAIDGDLRRIVVGGGGIVGGVATGAFARLDAFGHASCKAAGACVDTSVADCDDGIGCTLDSCTAAAGCSHSDAAGWSCGTQTGCSTLGSCSNGACALSANGKLFRKEVAIDALQSLQGASGTAAGGAQVLVRATTGQLSMRTLDPYGNEIGALVLAASPTGLPVGLVPLANGGAVIGIRDPSTSEIRAAGFDASGKQVFSKVLCTPNPTASGAKTAGEVASLLVGPCKGELRAAADGTSALWVGTTGFASLGCPVFPSAKIVRACVSTRKISLSNGANVATGVSCEASGSHSACAPNSGGWYVVDGTGVPSSDGGAHLVGRALYQVGYQEPFAERAYIEKRASNLVRSWRRSFVPPTNYRTTLEAGAEALGGFVAAGRTVNLSTNLSYLHVLRTNAAGGKLWESTLSGAGTWDLAALSAEANGIYLFGSRVAGGKTVLWQAALDQTATLLWQRDHPLVGAATVRNAWVGSDGGAWILGETAVQGAVKLAAVRADPWGHSTCSDAGACVNKTVSACDDGDSCTLDLCDGTKGVCDHVPSSGATCSGGVCSVGACSN